ncbi:MAG: hypothetical protein HFH32_04475 [Eubacterium sp.]|jgi:hypothetical protein|nr:hypothetical protein [Eubacterium sp.]
MLREELKKIWRPGMVLVLAVLGLIYYMMFLEFYISHFPNGPHAEGMLEIGKQMLEAYGTEVSGQEMADFESGIALLREEADRYVAQSSIGKKYGLETYEQYGAFRQETLEALHETGQTADQNETYADVMLLENYVQGEETGNIEGRLYAAVWYSQIYRRWELYGTDGRGDVFASQKEREHAQEMFFGTDPKWQNILPWDITQTSGVYAGRLLVWVCLSVCLLLAPLPVLDRMAGMRAVQYSSRHGHRIYRTQLAAVLLSALVLTAANLALFGGLFARQGIAAFFPCRIFSFMDTPFAWADWTYGSWCLVLVLMCFLMAAGTAGMVFFLSGGCPDYIAMLLRVLPLFIVLAFFSPKLMEDAFYYGNRLYQYTGVPYAELVSAAAVFAAGAVFSCLGAARAGKEP